MPKAPVKKPKRPDVPLSENSIPKLKEGSAEDVIADLRAMALADPERVITRNYYRVHGTYAESAWNQHFGTFHEFKRQAGIVLTRQQHAHERAIAKHASVDHYRAMAAEREQYAEAYVRPCDKRWQTILACSDLHDKEVDPFFLRVLLDTAKRVQPNAISIVGDLLDLPEFGKFTVDPREWDAAGRIKFALNKIIGPLRTACPNSQIDLLEGNHEARMLRQLADATPALRAVLSDIHGMTIQQLFGLKEFEVNYVGMADLSSFTQRDFNSELRRNYRVYNKAFLAHHFPDARSMGMPGVNGHHHKHQVWPSFSPVFGAMEWHQMGCGHKRDASYCNGEKWHMGFALAHIDTQSRAVIIEYINVTDFAVVGGKFYTREPSEIVAPLPAALI